MRTIYEDDTTVATLTKTLVSSGYRILQIFKLARSDRKHVTALLRHFNPSQSARVLDAGCGIGEVAKLMAEERPDLRFTLLNISPAQLALCPETMEKKEGRLEEMPFEDKRFDAVMMNYVLGHVDIEKAFSETARVLRPGGVLFIYDMTAFPDLNRLLLVLSYKLYGRASVVACAERHGFALDRMLNPQADIEDFSKIMPLREIRELFSTVRPIIYRFVNCK